MVTIIPSILAIFIIDLFYLHISIFQPKADLTPISMKSEEENMNFSLFSTNLTPASTKKLAFSSPQEEHKSIIS